MKRILLVSWLIFAVLFASYGQAEKLGKVRSSAITEISGISSYSYKKGYFWVHNDSGDKAQVYLIDSLASVKGIVKLKGVNAIDCEDISKFVLNGKAYLLLADIGNNLRNREVLTIYMFPEPELEVGNGVVNLEVADIIKIPFKYADKKRDAEAIFVDQEDEKLYIVSKRDFHSTVFSLPLNTIQDESKVHVLEPLLLLPFTFVTGADMRVDGSHIVIKNLTNVYLWERSAGTSVINTLSQPYESIPYIIEPQGEAICFDPNERYFYTISERPLGLDSYLYRYKF